MNTVTARPTTNPALIELWQRYSPDSRMDPLIGIIFDGIYHNQPAKNLAWAAQCEAISAGKSFEEAGRIYDETLPAQQYLFLTGELRKLARRCGGSDYLVDAIIKLATRRGQVREDG